MGSINTNACNGVKLWMYILKYMKYGYFHNNISNFMFDGD